MTDEREGYTVAKMYELAGKYREDLAGRPGYGSVAEIFRTVKNIPYVTDRASCGRDECLKRPGYTIRDGGDCDDKTILAGAALTLIGVPWEIVTSSKNEHTTDIAHVFLRVRVGGDWRPFDATYPTNVLYTKHPHAIEHNWSNPMLRDGAFGVATLEGDTIPNQSAWEGFLNAAGKQAEKDPSFNVKDAALKAGTTTAANSVGNSISSAIPGPIIGVAVAAVVATIIKLIGIKGPTDHLPGVGQSTADGSADFLARKPAQIIRDMYNSLPSDGKQYLAAQVEIFFKNQLARNNDSWPDQDTQDWVGSEGKGFMVRIATSLAKDGKLILGNYTRQPWPAVDYDLYHKIYCAAYTVLRGADIQNLQQEYTDYFGYYFKSEIVTPMAQLAGKKFDQISAGYIEAAQANGSGGSIPIGSGLMNYHFETSRASDDSIKQSIAQVASTLAANPGSSNAPEWKNYIAQGTAELVRRAALRATGQNPIPANVPTTGLNLSDWKPTLGVIAGVAVFAGAAFYFAGSHGK